MNKYTIYCTPQQTKKALELGAPMNYVETNTPTPNITRIQCGFETDIYVEIPTAEQMVGWLDEQGVKINFYSSSRYTYELHYANNYNNDVVISESFSTCKEASLAAIDAALEYLETQKN